jgi:hypothetical protein
LEPPTVEYWLLAPNVSVTVVVGRGLLSVTAVIVMLETLWPVAKVIPEVAVEGVTV